MPAAPHRLLRYLAPATILALAALLRLWALDRPGTLVFDELYYVRDAVSQLAHGFPTAWPDRDAAFGDPHAYSDTASPVAHPPLGKWLIGLGVLLFGPETAWGWRISAALAGVATVALTMRLGWLLSRSLLVAYAAGLMLALDGVHVVLSRVSLLDGFLTLFVVLGAVLVCRDQLHARDALWRRPWLLAAGLAFGAAAAVKWSGLYPLAAFLVLITLRDLLGRWSSRRRPLLASAGRALVAAAIALPAAFAAYLASWAGWIATADARGSEPWWGALWRWHAHSLGWHAGLDAEHAFQAHPLTWPLSLRPTAMYAQHLDGVSAVVSPLPNPLVTLGGVLALLLLAWVLLRGSRAAIHERSLTALGGPEIWASAFVLTGYLSGWVPWLLTFSRPAVFQFYSVVMTPFAALALGLVLAAFALPGRQGSLLDRAGVRLGSSPRALRGRWRSLAVFGLVALMLAVFFWSAWSGMTVPEWYSRMHVWLPTWY